MEGRTARVPAVSVIEEEVKTNLKTFANSECNIKIKCKTTFFLQMSVWIKIIEVLISFWKWCQLFLKPKKYFWSLNAIFFKFSYFSSYQRIPITNFVLSPKNRRSGVVNNNNSEVNAHKSFSNKKIETTPSSPSEEADSP